MSESFGYDYSRNTGAENAPDPQSAQGAQNAQGGRQYGRPAPRDRYEVQERDRYSGRSAQDRAAANLSRERIVRSYAAQDAARARNARMYSQEASAAYKQNAARARERQAQREALDARRREEEALRAQQRAQQREIESAQARTAANYREMRERNAVRRSRVVTPISSAESYERTRMNREGHEMARAQRDALSIERARAGRTSNREVIDGRGSIDSRAFNEHNELVGYSVDERDRPDPYLDVQQAKTRWRSRSESDPITNKRKSGGYSGGVVGRRNGIVAFIADLPPFVKIAVPVIIVLIIILVLIFVFG